MYQENCRVREIRQRSATLWEVSLYSPSISAASRPGHFVTLLPSENWEHSMRRPMSIAGVSGDIFRILFKIVGIGTERMREWKPDQQVDCIGPLGNTWAGYETHYPLLVGGGVGMAPIHFLHQVLIARHIPHELIVGARTAREHFLKHDPKSGIWLTTDDGSSGISGNVLKGLNAAIHQIPAGQRSPKIFCCGPPAMNLAVGKFALNAHICCDISVETVMACGTGICQGCAVELRRTAADVPSFRRRYALACVDGPIFNAEMLF